MRAQPKLRVASHTAWIATRHCEECEERANSLQVLDNATTDGNALVYVKLRKKGECEIEDDEEHQVSAVSKMAGDEWKKLSVQAKEPCPKKYEAAKVQCDRDPAIFLANGGTKEKGTVELCTIEGSVGDVVRASLMQETKPGQVRAK